MKKVFFILILQGIVLTSVQSQTFNVNELIKLAYLPTKNIDQYLKKKGFYLSSAQNDSAVKTASFIEKFKFRTQPDNDRRTINICLKNESKYITLYTSALNEYLQGQQDLIKAGFLYDTTKDLTKQSSMLFQKENISIKIFKEFQDSNVLYRFDLEERSIPLVVRYAEDLLRFNSHQFLVSYFGEQNVRKDMYYLSETELKRCSVIFSGTRRQAVFVWNNDFYLNDLAYVIITNKLPTQNAQKNDPLSGDNEWRLQNGVHAGMMLKDLIKINETDFDIYGNKSELAFLAKPNDDGKIDFKKTAVMLSCHDCYDNKIFNQPTVSALDVAKANLPMRVFDVVIYPAYRN